MLASAVARNRQVALRYSDGTLSCSNRRPPQHSTLKCIRRHRRHEWPPLPRNRLWRRRRSMFGRRAFSIAGATAWNSLPDRLKGLLNCTELHWTPVLNACVPLDSTRRYATRRHRWPFDVVPRSSIRLLDEPSPWMCDCSAAAAAAVPHRSVVQLTSVIAARQRTVSRQVASVQYSTNEHLVSHWAEF